MRFAFAELYKYDLIGVHDYNESIKDVSNNEWFDCETCPLFVKISTDKFRTTSWILRMGRQVC